METSEDKVNNHDGVSQSMNKECQEVIVQHNVIVNKYESLLQKITEKRNLDDEYENFLEEYENVKKKKRYDSELLLNHTGFETDTLKDYERLLKENEDLKGQVFESKKKIIAAEKRSKSVENKHYGLVKKLRERVECPVCLEIPESGPVALCTNGHLICSNCKGELCPTCRVRIGEGTSLLAVTVIENIEHKCRNQGCEEFLPLANLEEHKKLCVYRLVTCPSALCSITIAFGSLIEHVMDDCKHSFAKADKEIKDLTSRKKKFQYRQSFNIINVEAYKMDTIFWMGSYFFLNITKVGGGDWTVHVEMLGSEEECSKVRLEMALHKPSDEDMDGESVYKFIGEPVHMEEEKMLKKKTGLIVGNRTMESKLCEKNSKKKCKAKFYGFHCLEE